MSTDVPGIAPAESQNQSQSQSQEQVVTVSVQSSSDPEFERRIFARVHSAGRQLGRISEVLEALLALEESRADHAWSDTARAAVEAFRRMRADITHEKRLRDPERLIAELEALRVDDPRAFGALRARLVSWLGSGAS